MNDISEHEPWEPYTGFYPQDDFSKQLMLSIPKKVFVTLDGLGETIIGSGANGKLRWNFDIERGTIIYGSDETNDLIQIWWEGTPLDVTDICGSDERFRQLDANLDFFTSVEAAIYGELERLRKEVTNETPTLADFIKAQNEQ